MCVHMNSIHKSLTDMIALPVFVVVWFDWNISSWCETYVNSRLLHVNKIAYNQRALHKYAVQVIGRLKMKLKQHIHKIICRLLFMDMNWCTVQHHMYICVSTEAMVFGPYSGHHTIVYSFQFGRHFHLNFSTKILHIFSKKCIVCWKKVRD